jgi:bla regulator protein BlaR1
MANRAHLTILLAFSSFWAFGQTPSVRPEFDVVDVKPNNSADGAGSGSILPSGQFRAVNIPLKEVIKFAFDVRDEAIIGAPGWMDSERYDIVGKAAPVGAEETFWRSSSAVALMRFSYNWDQTFRLMVQTMLAERFKLAVRQEQRPMSVLALTVAKGGARLQKASEAGRPDCTRTVGAELRAQVVCKNMTMPDLARAMQVFAPLYADRPVLDLTGIEGTYDLKLEWMGRFVPNQEVEGMTMPGALEKTLGLKLEQRRMPMPVLVIDHVERPSEN